MAIDFRPKLVFLIYACCWLLAGFSTSALATGSCTFNSVNDYVCPGGPSTSSPGANPYKPGGNMPPGGGGYVPGGGPIPMPGGGDWCEGGASGSGGERIAQAAKNSVGASTANIPGTDGGNLGCAIAVSKMLDCAGYGVGSHLSTIALYNALNNSSCYEKVDTGHIDDADLQPGDVLVTKTGSRAGHTGIYVGGGQIVSNSSGGFQGSAPGTVQQNYSTSSWRGVTSRNPGGSAVFRRTCP